MPNGGETCYIQVGLVLWCILNLMWDNAIQINEMHAVAYSDKESIYHRNGFVFWNSIINKRNIQITAIQLCGMYCISYEKYNLINCFIYLTLHSMEYDSYHIGADSVDPDLCQLIRIYTVCFQIRNNLMTHKANHVDPDETAWNVLAYLVLAYHR